MDRDEQHNQEYFDAHLHEYSAKRIKGVARAISEVASSQISSICDVGSGTGSNLQKLADQLHIERRVAFDVSEKSLQKVSERFSNIEVKQLSILSKEDVAGFESQFDVVLLAAVLHHLVGKNPAHSSIHAQEGLINALSLVKPGGLLVVLEPVFKPQWAMKILFYMKKLLTSISKERISLFGYWNNIGAPLVMMYSKEQVKGMIHSLRSTQLRVEKHHKAQLGWIRMLIKKEDAMFVIQKD